MNLTIPCPDCQRALQVPEALLGHAVRCPSCSHTFVAPENLEETSSRPAARPPKIDYEDEPIPPRRSGYDEERDENYDEVRRRPQETPAKVHSIGVMLLVGGVFACVWGLSSTVLSHFACCFWPGMYYGLVMGTMAIIRGSSLLNDTAHRQTPPYGIANMMIINIINFDPVNLTLGIVVLVFLSDPEVKAYFRR